MWKPIGNAAGRSFAPPSANISPDRIIFYPNAVKVYDLRRYAKVCVYLDDEKGQFAVAFHNSKDAPGRLLKQPKNLKRATLFVSLKGAEGTFLAEGYRVKVEVKPVDGTGLPGLAFVFPLALSGYELAKGLK